MDANDRRRQASEDAADWWVLLNEPDVTQADRERLIDWFRESPVHVAEFLRIAQVHGTLERFQEWALIARDEPTQPPPVVPLHPHASPGNSFPAPTKISQLFRRTSIALVAAATLFGGAILWGLADADSQRLITKRAERYATSLSDGSVVQMAPETELRIWFEEKERGVVLERGRALFNVAKDPRRPFIVHAGRTQVRAVGTSFAVEHRPQDVLVTVSGGEVAVMEAPPRSIPFVSVPEPGLAAFTLTAGEQIAVPRTGVPASVRKIDTQRELAWVEGRLVFRRTPLADVIAEFNRYNLIQLRVTDAAIARRPISAVFDAADPESFIAFIEAMAPVRIIRHEHQQIDIAPSDTPATKTSH